MESYPFHSEIYGYSAISTENSVILFGGEIYGYSTKTTVAEFIDDSWRLLGDLVEKREGHRAISNGKSVLNIGGEDRKSTELWANVNGKTYSGLAGEPRLWDYYDYPELFLVDYNFCAQK